MTVPPGTGAYESTQEQILTQLQSGGTSGTQYTDGAAAPTHPIGTQIMFNNAGTETAVSPSEPLPVSGTFSPPANQRVSSQAGDFVAGAIVDMATAVTLLTSILSALSLLQIEQSDLSTSGTLSAAQPVIGTPVSNATVVLAVGQGQSTWKAMLSDAGGGFTSGSTVVADKSVDGGTTWISASFKVSGASPATTQTTVVGPGPLELTGNVAAVTHIRIRCTIRNGTETITVALRAGAGISDVGLISSIPAGTNEIGAMLLRVATGVALAADQSNTELRTSVYGKNSTAGDTALGLDASGRLTAIIQAVAGTALATGNNGLPVLNSAATGYVAAFGSNPSALTANTDAAFKWGAGGTTQVNHIMVQNNTAINVNFDLDAVTNAGSPILAPGQTIFLDVQTTAVHLQTNGTPNINGSTASNVVVRGWL